MGNIYEKVKLMFNRVSYIEERENEAEAIFEEILTENLFKTNKRHQPTKSGSHTILKH